MGLSGYRGGELWLVHSGVYGLIKTWIESLYFTKLAML